MRNALLLLLTLLPACSSQQNQYSSHGPASTVVPFELIDNRIFVDVHINGQGPFKFIFDTGGSNSLSPAAAKQLGLAARNAGMASGAGEKSVPMQSAIVSRLQVGDLNFTNQNFLVIDYSPIKRAFGFESFDGVFGFEILQSYSTSIDYENKQLTFLSNSALPQSSGYSAMPFEIIGDKPVVLAQIAGLDAKMMIDTGDRSALTVFRNFYEKPEIARFFAGKRPEVTGYGIGGPIPARLSRISSLRLGDEIKIAEVMARAPTTRGGFNSEKRVNASMGNEVLRQFSVIFDYKNRVAYLKANRSFGQPTVFTSVPNPQ